METIRYKINFSGHTISSPGLNNIKQNIIPDVLTKTFPSDANLNFVIGTPSNLDEQFRTEYFKLQQLTETMKQNYSQILNDFYTTQQISYPKEYLDLVKKAKKMRIALERNYPVLLEAYRTNEHRIADLLSINTNSRVGTGLNHLIKMQKIANYLNKNSSILSDSSPRTASYTENDEIISIMDYKSNALLNARLLEKSLNNNLPPILKSNQYGKITINPIYEKLALFKPPKNIHHLTLIASYPNGADEELDALLSFAHTTNADTLEVTLDNADIDKVEQVASREGQRGYLRDIIIADRSIININNCEFKKRKNHDNQ